MNSPRSPGVRQVVARDPATLLKLAGEPFLMAPETRSEAFPSPGCLLILRQGGLRDELFRLAAQRGVPGWFDPSVCVFQEIPVWLGSTGRKPLGDFERAALLEHLLHSSGGTVFRGRENAFLDPIDQLFGELVGQGITAAQFESAVSSLARAGREEFQSRRDEAIAAVYRAYLEALERLDRRDGRDTLADSALALRQDPRGLAERLGGRREIRIVGLADLRGGWRQLLAALAESPALDRITLYHTAALPVGEHIEEIPCGARVPVSILAAPDIRAELDTVAIRVRALLERGVRPDRIGIVSREARPYLDHAIRTFQVAGIPVAARRRIALTSIPVIRAVLTLLDAAAAGWTRHGLAALGAQPYFAANLDIRIINTIGYRKRVSGLANWADALDQLVAEAQAAEQAIEMEEERRPRSLPAAWVERARDRFREFASAAAPIDDTRPLREWLAWLQEWVEKDPWRIEERCALTPAERWDVVRLDLLAWTRFRDILAEWAEAERTWPGDGESLTASEFVERLRIMLSGDLVLWTETPRGVLVAEALAASHRSFDHLFLVGLNAGRFPRRASSSLLLAEPDREALRGAGLPLESAVEWEARERGLWDTLLYGASESVTASYSTQDDLGGRTNPSAFLEGLDEAARALEAGPIALPVCRSRDIATHAYRVACIERERHTGLLSPWNGEITTPASRQWLEERLGEDFIWSPTSLEGYAKCPWSWFSERLLHLNLLQDPNQDMDPLVRGTVLHDALRRFYQAAGGRTGGTVFLRDADRQWAIPLLRRSLMDAMEAASETLWLGHPALREIKLAELTRMLERFVEFEIAETEASFNPRKKAARQVRTAVESHELAFPDARLERDGMTLRYRGIVDRVEVGCDDRIKGNYLAAVDYKTSKYSAPGSGKKEAWEDGVVLQIPLYAHALAQLRPGYRVARVEYRAVKHAERLHVLNLVEVQKAGAQSDTDAEARAESALSAAIRHARSARDGEFPARPAPSCHCPPFCHGWDICRVAGGPDDGRDS